MYWRDPAEFKAESALCEFGIFENFPHARTRVCGHSELEKKSQMKARAEKNSPRSHTGEPPSRKEHRAQTNANSASAEVFGLLALSLFSTAGGCSVRRQRGDRNAHTLFQACPLLRPSS